MQAGHIPPVVNDLITNRSGQLSTFPFPPNVAGDLPPASQQQILRWMIQNYIWPQIVQRKPYEQGWDELLDMARAVWRSEKLFKDKDGRIDKEERRRRLQQLDQLERPNSLQPEQRNQLSDTVIFDAVDRLTNLNHFISFKERMPVKFGLPKDVVRPKETEYYHPLQDVATSANALVNFSGKQADFYRNHLILARHFYTYGCCFVNSEFEFKIKQKMIRSMSGNMGTQLQLDKFCVSYNPLSIRKLWLDPRLTVFRMEYQPCPFYYDVVPPFAIAANQYHPQLNPFGFRNTEDLGNIPSLFAEPATEAFRKAMDHHRLGATYSHESLMPPHLQLNLLWTFHPMLPFDISTMSVVEGAPMQRFIVQAYGPLHEAQLKLVRFQPSYYDDDMPPIYGSSQMPDTDSGAYSPAIGDILRSHYIQLTTALEQMLYNKEWANNPPTDVTTGSPALDNPNINTPGAIVEVNTHNDIRRRDPHDMTATTPAFLGIVREQAKTSSKAVDAILGKAMGSRTSATEASNAFQSAMSGVTTDINLFNFDLAGGYAKRTWEYLGSWGDPEVLHAISGTWGFALRPEHFALTFDLENDTGSSYIESIVRQGNLRYLLESTAGDPSINRSSLLRALLKEWKFPEADALITDDGRSYQIQFATEQAIKTLMGIPTFISPDQDHAVALKVKTQFLEDQESVWMKTPEYSMNAQHLVVQIQQHQYFLQLLQAQQMAQAMAMQQQSLAGGGGGMSQLPAPNMPPMLTGQVAQTHQV